MPTLNWIGKEKVINHHQDVPYKILEPQYTFGLDNKTGNTSENKIIHGDNLEALKSLLPEYEGKIKCIYIDPPYNTGNEGWVYNDNVNHPKLKKWLGQVVGKESEDLSRHDKWLCMMYPRLKLLHKLLADDGAIFISIDDNEQANLKLICDEIFGVGNFVTSLPTIMNLKGNQDQFGFAGTHEFTYVYARQKSNLTLGNLMLDEEEAESWEKDEIGFYKKGANLKATGIDGLMERRPNLHYPIYINKNFEVSDINDDEFKFELLPISEGKKMRWRWSKEKLFSEKYNLIVTENNGEYSIYKKQRPALGDLPTKKPKSTFYKPEYSSGNGTNQMKQIFGTKKFETPKPFNLIYDFLQVSTNKNSIILDSFAGSGTTAHAVLNLNKQDGGNRKFILVEMEDYANTITAERVKRVINGYGTGNKAVEGTGGNFTYYELGQPLFLDNELLNEEVGKEKIKAYVWYTETKSNYELGIENEELGIDNYFLGKKNGTAYYFYYEKDRLTTLDESFLRTLKTKASQHIIYADLCLLDQSLMDKYHIVFKKIPRDISRF